MNKKLREGLLDEYLLNQAITVWKAGNCTKYKPNEVPVDSLKDAVKAWKTYLTSQGYKQVNQVDKSMLDQFKELITFACKDGITDVDLQGWVSDILESHGYLQVEEVEAVKQERERILQKIGCLLWVDDDSKTAGLLVTGSVVYSEWQSLSEEEK